MVDKRIEKVDNSGIMKAERVKKGNKAVKSDEKGRKIVENRYLRVINMLLLK